MWAADKNEGEAVNRALAPTSLFKKIRLEG
jgi:hypothetical protein